MRSLWAPDASAIGGRSEAGPPEDRTQGPFKIYITTSTRSDWSSFTQPSRRVVVRAATTSRTPQSPMTADGPWFLPSTSTGKGFFEWGTRRYGVNQLNPHASEEFRHASTSECWTLFVF